MTKVGQIVEKLTWFKTLWNAPYSRRGVRRELREAVLHGLAEEANLGEAGRQIVADLRANYDYLGISGHISYLKESSDPGAHAALWVHPWGTPTLVFVHKRLPLVVQVNPAIRMNRSILSEFAFNREQVGELQKLLGEGVFG